MGDFKWAYGRAWEFKERTQDGQELASRGIWRTWMMGHSLPQELRWSEGAEYGFFFLFDNGTRDLSREGLASWAHTQSDSLPSTL